MSRFVVDPLNPVISPYERYVTKYMHNHFPNHTWDYFTIVDTVITIYYHFYKTMYNEIGCNPHIMERFDGQITISLNELHRNYEED